MGLVYEKTARWLTQKMMRHENAGITLCTQQSTVSALQARVLSESVEDGRPEWIRTIDLFRVKEAL